MERIAVIGLGRFGTRLAVLLADAGAEVIAIDSSRELVEDIRDRVALAVCMDATDAHALKTQGIDKVDVAIVGIGTNFEANALATAILKQLGVPRVISRAASGVRAEILSRIGADEVANPERESADRWRNRLMAKAVIERIELAEGFSLVQVAAPESFYEKSLEQLAVRKNYGVQVIAIRRTVQETDDEGQSKTRQFIISVPMADSVILPGDVLWLIGSDEAFEKLPVH